MVEEEHSNLPSPVSEDESSSFRGFSQELQQQQPSTPQQQDEGIGNDADDLPITPSMTPAPTTAASSRSSSVSSPPASEPGHEDEKQDLRPATNPRPTYNSAGRLVCVYTDCPEHNPTFSRYCEWKKHIHKHTRPYVCPYPDCNPLRMARSVPPGHAASSKETGAHESTTARRQGFTYEGGLERHKREVHGEGVEHSFYCPVEHCKRHSAASMREGSTGNTEAKRRKAGVGPFKRKDNLVEHCKRMHPDVDIEKLESTTRRRRSRRMEGRAILGAQAEREREEQERNERKEQKASDPLHVDNEPYTVDTITREHTPVSMSETIARASLSPSAAAGLKRKLAPDAIDEKDVEIAQLRVKVSRLEAALHALTAPAAAHALR